MKRFILVGWVAMLGPVYGLFAEDRTSGADATPLRVLLITGGCCHDYAGQTAALKAAAARRGRVEWTVVTEGGTGSDAKVSLYDNPAWATGYDVVVHNECFGKTDDVVYVRKITAAHREGASAVVVHCAMHTYRAMADDTWREFLGVTSRRHGPQGIYLVTPVRKDHPVMRGFPDEGWATPMDELYHIEKVWPTARVLAVSREAGSAGNEHAVAWVNDYHGTRVFGTTYGHGLATWHDSVFMELLLNGLWWAAARDK